MDFFMLAVNNQMNVASFTINLENIGFEVTGNTNAWKLFDC